MNPVQALQVCVLIRLCCFSVGVEVTDEQVARDPVLVLMQLQRKLASIDAEKARLVGEQIDRMAALARSLAVSLDMETHPEEMVNLEGCELVFRALIEDARELRQAWNTMISDELLLTRRVDLDDARIQVQRRS